MKTKSATWYECKVRYDKTSDAGETKKVTELFVVDALSFTEAECRIMDEFTHYMSGDIELKGLREAIYKEVVFSENDGDNEWFKVKVCFLSPDEKSGKEKWSPVAYLVQAGGIKEAFSNIEEMMRSAMSDYTIQSVVRTKVIDVFEYNK